MDHLAWGLRRRAGGRLIVTDGVFSMDGDVAPLPELVALARNHGCPRRGRRGPRDRRDRPGGRGTVAAAGGLDGEVDVIVGTLGKALGCYGAYVCGDRRDGGTC